MAQSDDKKYWLYIVPTDHNCAELMEKLKTEFAPLLKKMLVHDVRTLAQRPPWLRFVPTLVDRETKQMYGGADALEFVKGLPPEFTFESAGCGSNGKKRVMMTSIDSGDIPSWSDSYAIKPKTLEDEQKTQTVVDMNSSGRNAEQQRRNAQFQQTLNTYMNARNGSMQSAVPSNQMMHPRMIEIESQNNQSNQSNQSNQINGYGQQPPMSPAFGYGQQQHQPQPQQGGFNPQHPAQMSQLYASPHPTMAMHSQQMYGYPQPSPPRPQQQGGFSPQPQMSQMAQMPQMSQMSQMPQMYGPPQGQPLAFQPPQYYTPAHAHAQMPPNGTGPNFLQRTHPGSMGYSVNGTPSQFAPIR